MHRAPTPLLFVAILGGVTLTAQSVTLTARVDFGLSQEYAQQAVCADFDHDGNLDIAVTMEGYNQGKVEVLFGDGQADFGTSVQMASLYAWGLADGDFDGDGYVDLAATSYGWAQHGIRLWRNDQLGGFSSGGAISTLATPPVAAVTGDLDGDGHVDIAAISEGGGWAVDWFHGNGNGTFSTFRPVANTHNLVGRRILTGHFDADQHLDLLAIHSQGAMVLANDPQGTGNFQSTGGIATTESLSSAAVGDVDGDGHDDVLTVGTAVKVWHGNGNGTFTLAHAYATAIGALSTTLADLNGDGTDDLLLVGLAGAEIRFGQGSGAFGNPQTVPTGVWPKAGVVGDWNGDGWLDLAILCQNYAGQDAYLSVYEQVPPQVTATAVSFGAGCGSPALSLQPQANGLPQLGGTGRVLVAQAPSMFAGVAIGWSDQWAGTLPLPADLGWAGMPGCDLLQSGDVGTFAAAPASATTLTLALPLPNLPPLLGLTVFLQAYAVAPGQNLTGLLVSNGVRWVFGNQ